MFIVGDDHDVGDNYDITRVVNRERNEDAIVNPSRLALLATYLVARVERYALTKY